MNIHTILTISVILWFIIGYITALILILKWEKCSLRDSTIKFLLSPLLVCWLGLFIGIVVLIIKLGDLNFWNKQPFKKKS